MNKTTREQTYIKIPGPLVSKFKEHLKTFEKEGITYLAHGIKRKGVRTCFFSHDQWANIFLTHQIYQKDPFTLAAENTTIPCIFWEEIEMDSQGKQVDLWRKEVCQISNGLTFSKHAFDFHEIIAIGTSSKLFDIKALAFNKTLNEHLAQLIQPLRYLHFCYRYKGENCLNA